MNTAVTPAPFDISNYELADTAILTFKTPAGDADLIGADGVNPAQAEIFSPGSGEGLKANRRSARQQQLRMMRALRGESPENDVIKAEEELAAKLAGFTKRFINFPIEPIDLFSNPRLPHLAKQTMEFIDKFGNFSKGSSAS